MMTEEFRFETFQVKEIFFPSSSAALVSLHKRKEYNIGERERERERERISSDL
jgi:hypothetical protein